MIIKHPIKDFHMDDQLYEQIVEMPKRINKDKDASLLIVGDPGNGKSTITSQIAYVISPSIVNEMCFFSTVEDFKKYAMGMTKRAEEQGKPLNHYTRGKANVHDEARETGGINVLTSRIRKHWDFIYENRFLNMFQFFIQSDFWSVPRSIIYHRALFMIWVVEDDKWDNGTYLFFSKRAMKRLYDRGKKTGDMTPTGYDFKGRFVSFWAGHPDYLKQKSNNFMAKYGKEEKEKKELTPQEVLYWIWDRIDEPKPSLIIKALNIDKSTYFKNRKKYGVESVS